MPAISNGERHFPCRNEIKSGGRGEPERENRMKIYTGSGDRGKTSLFSGERLSKGSLRVEAYGALDELGSVLGMVASHLSGHPERIAELQRMQRLLLVSGSWIATTEESTLVDSLKPLTREHVREVEACIDRLNDRMPALTSFILPGGTTAAAAAHLARTVCRRAERHVVRFMEASDERLQGEELEMVLIFLNRLSDYCFVLARYCNHEAGIQDVFWKG